MNYEFPKNVCPSRYVLNTNLQKDVCMYYTLLLIPGLESLGTSRLVVLVNTFYSEQCNETEQVGIAIKRQNHAGTYSWLPDGNFAVNFAVIRSRHKPHHSKVIYDEEWEGNTFSTKWSMKLTFMIKTLSRPSNFASEDEGGLDLTESHSQNAQSSLVSCRA